MLGIPLGLLWANAGEWWIHKHLLHGSGKNKKSFWSFHWNEHHRASRKNGFVDAHYHQPLTDWNSQSKEALGLAGLALAHAPLLPVAPFFTGAVWYSIWRYHQVHKRSHLDPEWAKRELSWHYDHHMGPEQDANWCVSKPWFDHLMGTRQPYVGTLREKQDEAKRAKRLHKEAADD